MSLHFLIALLDIYVRTAKKVDMQTTTTLNANFIKKGQPMMVIISRDILPTIQTNLYIIYS